MIEPKYIQQLKKGDSVQYMQKLHTVQEWKGKLFIQYTDKKDNQRKRLYMVKHPDYLFTYGSFQDWIFNDWYRIYPDYEVFRTFAENDLAVA